MYSSTINGADQWRRNSGISFLKGTTNKVRPRHGKLFALERPCAGRSHCKHAFSGQSSLAVWGGAIAFEAIEMLSRLSSGLTVGLAEPNDLSLIQLSALPV